MRESKYVSIDPGETTGLAKLSKEAGWEWLQMGPSPHHLKLFYWLKVEHPDLIVCERFFYQKRRDKVLLTSVEYIGVVQLYHQVRHSAGDPVKVAWQNPSDRDWWTNERLQVCGLLRHPVGGAGGMQHANDATRHLLRHITVTEKDNSYVMQLKP